MGFKERVTLQQIKFFLAMESHDEKRALAEEKEKEKLAKAKMKQHLEDMERKKREEKKMGIARDEGRFITNTGERRGQSYQSEPIVESKKYFFFSFKMSSFDVCYCDKKTHKTKKKKNQNKKKENKSNKTKIENRGNQLQNQNQRKEWD
jgi:hypothetical protein